MKLRYSPISDYYRCPTLFKYKHIDGLKEEGPKSIALAFGTGIHMGIELIFTEGLETALSVFSAYWSSLEFHEFGPDKLTPEQHAVNAIIFLTRFDRMHKAKFEPLHLEHKLSGQINGIDFEGTADFIGTYKGVMSVVDWKTAAYRFPRERIVVNEQMALYAELAQQQLGIEVKQVVYITFIKDKESPVISTQARTLTPQSRLDLKTNLEQVALATKGPLFKNTNSCIVGTRRCAFYENCWGKDSKE